MLYFVFSILKKYKTSKGFVFLFLLVPAICHSFEGSQNYLLEKASSLNLHNDRYWHILLHYHKTITGYKSRIDDPGYFLAENGKTDPQAELIETIKYLFGSQENNSAPVCRFYARYRWLKQKLDPDNIVSDDLKCDKIENIKPGQVSVIFPTYYMNNPASMFGHTFLTINTRYKSARLSDSVNYAARADSTNGVDFAIRGIFGFFKGYYAVMPYYKKIQEYSDINQRDIWEYRLNLTENEVRKMIWHITELENIYTDYYFFKENCSYNLLYLIEAARPETNLVKRFKTVVIPVDTIKAMKDEDLIESADFRPSRTSSIRYRQSLLSKNEQKLAKLLIKSKHPGKILEKENLNRQTKINVLDLSIELTRYFLVDKKISKENYKSVLISLLRLRSTLGKSEIEIQPEIPERPDLGHDSNRITLSAGISDDDFFQELRFRPAFTDLSDTDYVQDKGVKIEFLDTKIRYFTKDKRLFLEQLDLLDIKSISPRDEIFRPISWKVETGFIRKLNHRKENALIYQLGTGGGFAWNISSDKYIAYTLFEQRAEAGGNLKNNFDLGLGMSGGLIALPHKNFKVNIFSRFLRFVPDDCHSLFEAGITNNFKVSRNNHLTFEFFYENIRKNDNTEAVVSWNFFF
jgi:hypothetical protein